MTIVDTTLRQELKRLIKLFRISKDSEPFLTIKKLRKNWGLYKKGGEIIINSEIPNDSKISVLRHEFAHFLQDIRGERVNEKKASKFEVNVKSNFPYYPPQKINASFKQTKLVEVMER